MTEATHVSIGQASVIGENKGLGLITGCCWRTEKWYYGELEFVGIGYYTRWCCVDRWVNVDGPDCACGFGDVEVVHREDEVVAGVWWSDKAGNKEQDSVINS